MEWPDNLPKSSEFPTVSVVTPTYNRRKFLPWLLRSIKAQAYPAERIEWLVFDDGTDRIWDVLEPHAKAMNIRYFTSDQKCNIGVKRNRLHSEARGEIIVVMDDDDYYPPCRISHAVTRLKQVKGEFVGSSRNHLFFTDDKSIWEVGPYGPNHATFGTFAFAKSLVAKTSCDESVTFAEEVSFTKQYSIPLGQLDPMKTMLVMCHSENTFNKNTLRTNPSPLVRKTNIKVNTILKNKEMRDFYSNA
jgi:glycosyltransferase involved in cell wall biosynthesis